MPFLIVCGVLAVVDIPHDGRYVIVMALPLSGWLVLAVLRDTPRLALIVLVALWVSIVIVTRMIYY
jgi:hypothetical protein